MTQGKRAVLYAHWLIAWLPVLSLSLVPGRVDGSPPRSSPGSFTGISDYSDIGGWAMTPTMPGRVLGSVTPDVLPSHQRHCNVDKWQSLDVRFSGDRPPTVENSPCAELCHRDARISGPITRPATVRIFHVYGQFGHVCVVAAIPCVSDNMLVGNECCTCRNVIQASCRLKSSTSALYLTVG